MNPREHVRLTGTIEVGLAPEQAFQLFTATGEAEWRDSIAALTAVPHGGGARDARD